MTETTPAKIRAQTIKEATAFGHAVLAAARIPELAAWVDRQLRRWPWLYRKLGG
jgi:hypothetical protein